MDTNLVRQLRDMPSDFFAPAPVGSGVLLPPDERPPSPVTKAAAKTWPLLVLGGLALVVVWPALSRAQKFRGAGWRQYREGR